MKKMEIKTLANIDFTTIFGAFSKAFADYELQLNAQQLQTMLQRRGFNPELSFAAFEDGKITAFTLNGIGNFNGTPTAYDTGTGTIKEYRGQGLATKIFEHSIPHLREAGIKQYLLEVLQHNTKAVSVYRNLGFEVTREFNYFIGQNETLNTDNHHIDTNHSIREINISDCKPCAQFCDFHPSWQNSFESIERMADNFLCFGAFVENTLVGYCIFEPLSGDITQIAVDPAHRKKGIATALLRTMTKHNRNSTIKAINTDITCTTTTNFLKARNIALKGQQFEMIKTI